MNKKNYRERARLASTLPLNLAAAASSMTTHSALPRYFATSKGVLPSRFTAISEAPSSINAQHIEAWPIKAALCNAVQPSILFAYATLAFADMSNKTHALRPYRAAISKEFQPSYSQFNTMRLFVV